MASDAPSHVLSSSDNPVAVEDIKNEPEVPDVSLLDFCAQLEDYTPTVSTALLYQCWHIASYNCEHSTLGIIMITAYDLVL